MSASPAARLIELLETSPHKLRPAQVLELEGAYRQTHRQLATLRASGAGRERLRPLEALLARAQGQLVRERTGLGATLQRVFALALSTAPRVLRAEWRLVLGSFVLFYGLAALAFVLVQHDRELAYVFLEPAVVDHQIGQLEGLAPGEAFRGNFTFEREESTATALMITLNNVRVSFFLLALALIPPLFVFVLVVNAFMVGTYLAVAADFDQLGSITSILMTHGTLELQAIVLAFVAGVLLVRPLVWPGVYTRAESIRRGSGRALAVFAPVVLMLFVAGAIEGYVTAHYDLPVRGAFIGVSALALAAWFTLGGRNAPAPLP